MVEEHGIVLLPLQQKIMTIFGKHDVEEGETEAITEHVIIGKRDITLIVLLTDDLSSVRVIDKHI